MKLYLSSYRFGEKAKELASLFGQNKNVALIANSIDAIAPQERKEKIKEGLEELRSIGLESEEIDLRNYFGKEKQLTEKLQEFGGVWVRGGNTFVLRRAFAYSGFDNFLQSKRENKNFVYGGYSAGICILAPDLHAYDIVDPPTIVPDGYKSEIIWSGLGFFDYYLEPHYKSNHPETLLVDKEVDYLREHKLPFKTLRDGEVIIQEI